MIIEGKLNEKGLKVKLNGMSLNLDEERTREFFRSIWQCGGYYIYRIGSQFGIYVDDNCLYSALEKVLGYKLPRGYN